MTYTDICINNYQLWINNIFVSVYIEVPSIIEIYHFPQCLKGNFIFFTSILIFHIPSRILNTHPQTPFALV